MTWPPWPRGAAHLDVHIYNTATGKAVRTIGAGSFTYPTAITLSGATAIVVEPYGYSVSLEQVTEKMRHDLFYIKHMSFWLDLRILVDTVKIALFGRGAK